MGMEPTWHFGTTLRELLVNAREEIVIEATNKAIVRRWFDEVWNKRQEASVDKLFAPHAVAYGLGDGDMEVHGPAQFKIFFRNKLGSFRDLHISVENIVAEADKVMVRVLLEGTHQGGGLGIPATGHRAVCLARIFFCKTGGYREIKDRHFKDLQMFRLRFIRVGSGLEQKENRNPTFIRPRKPRPGRRVRRPNICFKSQ